MKVKIYAPIDCDVLPIEQCEDEMFAQKMMGDGIVIIPKSNLFNSILDSGKVSLIFETKHAIFFETENVKILMHIGMDTVKLNGTPFEVFVEENDEINLGTKIVNVDLDEIDRNKLSIQTPICFDNQNIKNIKIKIINQSAKRGELIAEAEIILLETNNEEKDKKTQKDEYEYLLLNKYVGGNQNILSHLNCVTRFRFNIVDKDLVDAKKLKSISFVRGINWSGNQLQVIIGPEVTKVRDKYITLFDEKSEGLKKSKAQKFNLKKAFIDFISNVMLPALPILMVGGMGQAIFAILTMTGAIDSISTSQIPDLTDTENIFAGSLFVITYTALQFVGMFMCFNTVKYMKGNQPMGVLVALAIASPFLYPGKSWVLFTVGPVDIKFQGYTTMIFPQIAAGFIYVYTDRFIKSWIPASLDIILRHFLAFFITCVFVFFVAGPILGLVETGIFYIFNAVQKIPFGIGIGIFGFAWTFLVLTGMHMALATAMMAGFLNNPEIGSNLLALTSMTSITTIATCAAVSIKAKEYNMKTISFGALVPGAFGISEPTYYSISMIRPILFLPVVIARGLTGVLIGIIDVRWYQPGGRGVLGFTSAVSVYADSWNLPKYFICMTFIFIVCFALTLLLYKERKSEKKEFFKFFKFINKFTTEFSNKDIEELRAKILEIQNQEYINNSKLLEKKLVSVNNKKFVLEKIKKREKINQQQKTKIQKLDEQIKTLELEIKNDLIKVEKKHNSMENIVLDKLIKMKTLKDNEQKIFKDILFNITHNLEINYKMIEGTDENYGSIKKIKRERMKKG